MADADLTTPQVLAPELGVDVGEPRLQGLITRASRLIRTHLGRQLHYQAGIVEKVRGRGGVRLMLQVTPIVSMTSLVLDDGSSLVLDADYTLDDAEAGLLYRASGWPHTGVVQPGLLWDFPVVGSEKASIVATYSGGWVCPAQSGTRTLPDDIEHACIETCASLWRSAGMDRNVASESLGNSAVGYFGVNTAIGRGEGGLLPDVVVQTLAPYRRALS